MNYLTSGDANPATRLSQRLSRDWIPHNLRLHSNIISLTYTESDMERCSIIYNSINVIIARVIKDEL